MQVGQLEQQFSCWSVLRQSQQHRIAKKDKPTIYDCKQMVSYIGWLDYTDTYDYYLRYIKPKINFQQLKRRISAYDRRVQKRKREQTINN